jgi:hypothetical protein
MTFKQMMKAEEIENRFFVLQKRLDAIVDLIEQYQQEYKTSVNGERRCKINKIKDQLLEIAHNIIHQQDRLFHLLP